MQELQQSTVEKTLYLKDRGYHIVEVWECDIKRELEHDEDMKRYFDTYDLVDPLEPRDAFFGGRTNATKLFHECKEDEKIRYVVSAPPIDLRLNLTRVPFLIDTSILPRCTPGATK